MDPAQLRDRRSDLGLFEHGDGLYILGTGFGLLVASVLSSLAPV